MGAQASKPRRRVLTQSEIELDLEGKLYKCINDVWTSDKTVPFVGSYAFACALRRDKKPRVYEVALTIHHQEDNVPVDKLRQAEEQFKDYQTVTTIASDAGGSAEEVEVSLTEHVRREATKSIIEPLTKSELKAKQHSVTRSKNKSKAHLIPDDPACRKHWEKIAEVACGFQFDKEHVANRQSMAEKISSCRVNNLILCANHGGIYDTLSQGILLVIPLLNQKELASWDHKTGYKILVTCSSPDTYELFSQTTNVVGCDWATKDDLDLATSVLEQNTKILADSLVANWSFHESQGEDFRLRAMKHLKETMEREGNRVRVPDLRANLGDLKLHPNRPWDSRMKNLVIDLAQVYEGDAACFIPDPWLLALKAASNWSYFAYGKHNSMFLKLLPACACEEEEDDEDMEPPEFGDMQPAYERICREQEISRIQLLEFATPGVVHEDDDSVSTISGDDLGEISVVLDDSSQ